MREALVHPEHIVTHEKPRASRVRAIAAAMRRGEKMPPVQLAPQFCEHWTQGPTRMESTGVGYGVVDGHHRHAAHIMVHGKSVPMKVDFHGTSPIEGPAASDLIQSPEDFDRWFGASQMVVAQGKPQVVFHGTLAEFTTPKLNGSGLFFVTPDPASVAEFVEGRTGARVMSFYACIKNPFDASDKASIDAVVAMGRERGWIKGDVATLTYDGGKCPISVALLRSGDHVAIESREVVAAAKAMGHDGLKITERGMVNFAVFDPKQVRTAAADMINGVQPALPDAAAEAARQFLATVGKKVAPHA